MICNLCPRNCGALRDETRGEGFCGMPERPWAARASLHRWEEPCLTGDNGAGTIFFSGCTLRCRFCQNGSISRENFGKPLTDEDLRRIFRDLHAQGAACIELVTPPQFTAALARVLADPIPGGLPVVWNSGGYEKPETLRLLEGKVQVYMPDFKFYSPDLAARYAGAADYPQYAKAAIQEMYRQTGPFQMEDGKLRQGVLIRHLLLPGHVREAKQIMDWVAETFPVGSVLFSLMAQYTPMGDLSGCPELQRTVRPSELRSARTYLENLGLPGYVQDLESAGPECIPLFDLTGL